MATLTPLKKDVEAVASMLEAGADSPEALAKQVIKHVYEALETRVTHVVTFELSPGVYCTYGPYATRTAAETARTKIPMAQVARRGAVSSMVGPAMYAAQLEAADEVSADRGDFVIVREDAALFRKGWNGKQATRASFVART